MAVTGSAPTRVLLIDDDQDLNALLARYLRGFNFEVSVTVDPHEGLQALEGDPPDIVILDVMLPDLDGFAVCRKVRERSRVPIVMLTARGAVGDRIVGLELGADDYVSKPFEPREGAHAGRAPSERQCPRGARRCRAARDELDSLRGPARRALSAADAGGIPAARRVRAESRQGPESRSHSGRDTWDRPGRLRSLHRHPRQSTPAEAWRASQA